MSRTKKILLFGFLFGLAVFFVEDYVLGVLHPEWVLPYWKMVGVTFCWHGVTLPSMVWLLFVVAAIIVPEKRD